MFDFPEDRLPLLPDAVMRQHKVHEHHDSRFRACARLKQALWRAGKKIPIGSYKDGDGRTRKLGNRISPLAAAAGANFISDDVRQLVRRELAYREPGALIDEDRVWANLLSSAPLAFNVFGVLKLDPALATAVFRSLLPKLVDRVLHIQFEHSPARGDARFTADGTAFDVFVTYRAAGGELGFIAIEVKYSETMGEPDARVRKRYDDLSESCGLYTTPDHPSLRRGPFQQLWREHMLAQVMVQNQLYDQGAFVLVAPKLNSQVQRAAQQYKQFLAADETRAPFINISLEDVIFAIEQAGAVDEAEALHERYCNFTDVHRLIDEPVAPRKPKAAPPPANDDEPPEDLADFVEVGQPGFNV